MSPLVILFLNHVTAKTNIFPSLNHREQPSFPETILASTRKQPHVDTSARVALEAPCQQQTRVGRPTVGNPFPVEGVYTTNAKSHHTNTRGGGGYAICRIR